MKIISVVSILLFLLIVYFYIPIKDTIFGVPFDIKDKPTKVSNNSLIFEINTSCNNIYTREVGLLFEPPIPFKDIMEVQTAISGKVTVIVKQGKKELEKTIQLTKSGFNINPDGIWMKKVIHYSPLNLFFCGEQEILVKVEELNINLDKHSIKIYVSRDRRP